MNSKTTTTTSKTFYAVSDSVGKYLTDNGFTSYSQNDALKLNTHVEAYRLALLYNAHVVKVGLK